MKKKRKQNCLLSTSDRTVYIENPKESTTETKFALNLAKLKDTKSTYKI